MTLGCHLLQCTPSHTLASNVNPSYHNTRGGMYTQRRHSFREQQLRLMVSNGSPRKLGAKASGSGRKE